MLASFLFYSDKLSFWIDNIHCYATQTEHFELDGGLNPPILVVCTGDEDQVG